MLLLVVFLCCVCAWWCVRHWHLQRLTARVPTMPGVLPFIGHMHKLFGSSRKLWEFFSSIQEHTIKEGGIMKFWIGPVMTFAVTDPKLAQALLNANENKFYVYKFGKSWIGEGLFTADVAKWRRNRKILMPTFNQHLLDEFLVVFNEQSLRFIDLILENVGKEAFDFYPYLERNFLEIICRTALGLTKTDTLNVCNEEYAHAASNFLRITCKRFQNIFMHPSLIYNWTRTKTEEEKAVKILKKMCFDVLDKRKSEDNNNNIPEGQKKSGLTFRAFLDQLLELKAQGVFTDEDIHDEVNTMIMGGSDTTAHAMIFILILVATNSDVQDRLYDEIQEVLGGSTRDVVKEDLAKFVYMEAVIKESMRVFPIAPLVSRRVDKNMKIGDIYLPSGAAIIVFISAIHQNECWGNDAHKFKPERWLDSSIVEKLPAFAPFSFGRRGCIGKNYAMMSMKVFLAHVLRRYRLIRKKSPLKLKCDSLLKPIKGHHVSVELR